MRPNQDLRGGHRRSGAVSVSTTPPQVPPPVERPPVNGAARATVDVTLDSDQARRHLTLLYPELDGDQRIALWMGDPAKRGNGTTLYAASIDDAVAIARRQIDRDLYVHMGPARRDYGPSLRITGIDKERPPAYITAVWLDIDVAGVGHRKPNLPGSTDDALELLDTGMFRPSMTIHSGGGLHIYTALREPLYLDSIAAMQDAAALVWRWQRLHHMRAAQHGWGVDSTHSLAQVLRLGGSFNWKTGTPRKVCIL